MTQPTDKNQPRKPLDIFADDDEIDLDAIPATPKRPRDVESLDRVAEKHGFTGGGTSRVTRSQPQPEPPQAPPPPQPAAKPPAQRQSNVSADEPQPVVRRFKRSTKSKGPRTHFNQTIPVATANAFYDFARRNEEFTIAEALTIATRLLLKDELKRTNDEQTRREIQEAIKALPK